MAAARLQVHQISCHLLIAIPTVEVMRCVRRQSMAFITRLLISRASQIFSPGSSLDLVTAPSQSGLEHMTDPRPGSTASFLSRRHSEPPPGAAMSDSDRQALERYAQELLTRVATADQACSRQIQSAPLAPAPRIIDFRNDAGRSNVGATSVTIPYSGRNGTSSHALSQARYGPGGQSAALSGYGPQQAMSIAALSQGTGASGRKRSDQRYEVWANHE